MTQLQQVTREDSWMYAPGLWRPISTAPKDNRRPLYLAAVNEDGTLQEIDFDGSWGWISEDDPNAGFYGWCSAFGRVEEPTHWCYQGA